jgi:hypothetical protein
MHKLLYLRYRTSPAAPWITLPILSASFPSAPVDSLPVIDCVIATAPEVETPCGCPEGDAVDDHLTLRANTLPHVGSDRDTLMTFLVQYKLAALHEAKMEGFASSFVTATLTHIKLKETSGAALISFRLATPLV